MAKKSALGKGLGALIDDSKYEKKPEAKSSGVVNEIEVSKIQINPFQPRSNFNQEALEELASSIKELGIIQPITVRRAEKKYQIISGERRLKAAKLAGLETIPAFVREADDQAMLEMALVENIQREDLNAIEIAISYQRLIDECALTQDALSERVGKKRSTISNYLRLLKLPAEIQVGIRDKKISMGHARSLINIEDPQNQLKAFFQIVNQGLSVRKSEELVDQLNNPPQKKRKQSVVIPENYKKFTEKLRENIHPRVELKRDVRGKGRLIIPFNSDNDLDNLVDMFSDIEKKSKK